MKVMHEKIGCFVAFTMFIIFDCLKIVFPILYMEFVGDSELIIEKQCYLLLQGNLL